jgi:Family of unknown function (DUF6493)
MTTSALDEVILAADTEKCAIFFETMSESQRKALAPRALQWISAINGYICRDRKPYMVFDKSITSDIEFYQSIQARVVAFPTEFSERSAPVARMAVLATCGFPEVKKAGARGTPDPDLAARLLKARKPSWIDKWCAYVVKDFPASHWSTLYELEKSGICTVERNAGYWISMLCGLPNAEGMYEILAQDEKVRDEIWEMLADQGVVRMLAEPEQISHEIFRKQWTRIGSMSGSKQIGTRKSSEMWREALVRLANEGLIDRNRLIEYSFTALSGAAEKESKKSYYQHVSTADFAITLNQELTRENIASYKSQFASLLGATHKDVSNYASTVLAAMPEGSLSASEICSCIAPAFLNKSKEPAESALKLLTRLAKEDLSKRSEYGPAILAAFGHSSKEIHKKALALVESTKMLEDHNLLCEFRQRMDMLAGMERTNAAKLADKYQTSDGTPVSNAVPVPAQTANADELYARVSKLDKTLRALAKIDDAVEATKKTMRLDAPVSLDALEFPRLNPEKAVKPIANLDDLVYMYTKVWSGKSDAMELEAVLEGVSRLCHERPADFQQKTDVLRQKALKVTEEFLGFGWHKSLAHLASCWIGESTGYGSPTVGAEGGSFFIRRCLAVAKRAASKQPAPLLAAPTHGGGWIDPEILVKRVLEYFWLKIEPDRIDFIQALLRLAPENRTAALEAAASAKGEIGDALRYALGGSDAPRIQTPEYWVAAFRARDPKGTSSELLKFLPNFGPDGAEPATYGLNMEPVEQFAKDRYASISAGLPNFLPVKSADPDFPGGEKPGPIRTQADFAALSAKRNKYAFFPTVLLHDNSNSWFSGTEPYNWLHNRESLLALYAKRMLQNIESIGSYWHGDFELMFDADISMAGNGRYFICTAMSSKNNDLARLAVDALISAVGECRIGASAYGEAMAAILPAGVITAVRWTRGLRDMSRTSTLHAQFTWQAVCTLIEKASITSTQQIPFLELLVELQLEHGFRPESTLVQVLSSTTGGGKGAKLAKTILGFSGQDNSTLQAALQDLESRIKRAERWQSWSKRSAAAREKVEA